jgi:phosphate transport system substrate-binding protein
MKPGLIGMVVLGAIGVTSLSSCTAPATTGSAQTSGAQATAATQSAQSPIKIGGSSSAYPALKTLAPDYEAKSNHKINTLEPGQSEAVIAGIKQGLIDVGAISKQLEPKEAEGMVEFRLLAKDALVVATHANVTGVKTLTTDDLKAIYSGKITNWKQVGGPDAKIVLLDRPEDESAKKLLRKHYLGADLENSPEAVVLKKEGELIAALQSTPYSIGAFSLAHAISHNLPVNRLGLNGIEANRENVQAGKYVMVRPIGLVWKKNPTASTQQLIDFAFSPEGAKKLGQDGFIPQTSGL